MESHSTRTSPRTAALRFWEEATTARRCVMPASRLRESAARQAFDQQWHRRRQVLPGSTAMMLSSRDTFHNLAHRAASKSALIRRRPGSTRIPARSRSPDNRHNNRLLRDLQQADHPGGRTRVAPRQVRRQTRVPRLFERSIAWLHRIPVARTQSTAFFHRHLEDALCRWASSGICRITPRGLDIQCLMRMPTRALASSCDPRMPYRKSWPSP